MPDSEISDPLLLGQWLMHRREAAFHELVRRYHGLVRAVALRSCGDAAMADEITQLTFITFARRAAVLSSRVSLGGWLHLTALMQTRNLIRKRQREDEKRRQFKTHMEIDATEEEELPASAWQRMQPVLDAAMAALPERDRDALIMRYYRSRSVREIAGELGIAVPAAEKRLERAVRKMRGELVRRGCAVAVASLPAALHAGLTADAALSFSLPLSSVATVATAAAATTYPVLSLLGIIAMTKKTGAIVAAIVILAAGTATVATLAGKDKASAPPAVAEALPADPSVRAPISRQQQQQQQQPPSAPGSAGGIAATVEGLVVTRAELDYNLAPELAQLVARLPRRGPEYERQEKEIRDRMLDSMIDRKLLLSGFFTLSKIGAKLPDHVIDEEIRSRIKERFNGDGARFHQELKSANLSEDKLRSMIREDLIVQSIRSEQFPAASPPSPAEINQAYAEMKDQLRDLSQDRITFRQIFLPRIDPGSTGSTPDSQLDLADKLITQIRSGGDIAELAKRHSRDSSSSETGGDLQKNLPRTSLSPEFAAILFHANEGDLLGPLAEAQGFAIVKIVHIEKAPAPPLSEVRGRIESMLREQKTSAACEKWLAGKRRTAVISKKH